MGDPASVAKYIIAKARPLLEGAEQILTDSLQDCLQRLVAAQQVAVDEVTAAEIKVGKVQYCPRLYL